MLDGDGGGAQRIDDEGFESCEGLWPGGVWGNYFNLAWCVSMCDALYQGGVVVIFFDDFFGGRRHDAVLSEIAPRLLRLNHDNDRQQALFTLICMKSDLATGALPLI